MKRSEASGETHAPRRVYEGFTLSQQMQWEHKTVHGHYCRPTRQSNKTSQVVHAISVQFFKSPGCIKPLFKWEASKGVR